MHHKKNPIQKVINSHQTIEKPIEKYSIVFVNSVMLILVIITIFTLEIGPGQALSKPL